MLRSTCASLRAEALVVAAAERDGVADGERVADGEAVADGDRDGDGLFVGCGETGRLVVGEALGAGLLLALLRGAGVVALAVGDLVVVGFAVAFAFAFVVCVEVGVGVGLGDELVVGEGEEVEGALGAPVCLTLPPPLRPNVLADVTLADVLAVAVGDGVSDGAVEGSVFVADGVGVGVGFGFAVCVGVGVGVGEGLGVGVG